MKLQMLALIILDFMQHDNKIKEIPMLLQCMSYLVYSFDFYGVYDEANEI